MKRYVVTNSQAGAYAYAFDRTISFSSSDEAVDYLKRARADKKTGHIYSKVKIWEVDMNATEFQF